ncbi:T9SS type A sorting domain-containing protein [Bacteroidota bacterium]
MHYNLLNYGVTAGGCNNTTNNVNDKNQYLHTILSHVNPHILTVNEINCSVQTYDILLSGCLDVYMQGKFERIDKTCNATNPLSNMVYYRADLLEFYKQDAIQTNVRDINVVRFFYKSPDLAVTHDTTFITIMLAHLKAGTGWDDKQERATETNEVMQYLSQHPNLPNRIFLGDLNIYEANEQAFKNLTEYSNASLRFYDPINEIGDWHNNSSYSHIHTQSTHSSMNCFIGGGMDDRFDFILIDESVKDNAYKVGYIPDSYTTAGQDGYHFNKNLIESTANESVPSSVLYALYNMSDHLPVYCDLMFEGRFGVHELSPDFSFRFISPVNDNLVIEFLQDKKIFAELDLSIVNQYGNKVLRKVIKMDTSQISIPIDFLASGMYYLRIQAGRNVSKTIKFIVIR